MKNRFLDIYVYDKILDVTVLAGSTKSEKEAQRIVTTLEALGIDAVYGVRPDRIVDGKCVYEED